MSTETEHHGRVLVGTSHLIERNRGDFEYVCYPDLKIRWLIGGRLVSTDNSFLYTFENIGEYFITCKVYDETYKLLDSQIKKVIVEAGGN